MADETKQVTVVFESQINEPNESDNHILLSGPIEVFAVVDNFEDLGSTDLRDAVLNYIYEYNTLKKTENIIPSIVVFVADVTNLSNPDCINDTDIHRGAYFRIDKDVKISDIRENYSVNIWREVLLGTHSHSNPELLEKLSEIISINKETGKLEVIDGEALDNNRDILDELRELLPDEAKNILAEAKRYDDLVEPYSTSLNHLDAPLERLSDTYDWLYETRDACGSCRDIYLELTKADKKLYLVKDSSTGEYSLSTKVKEETEDGEEILVEPKGQVGWFKVFYQDVNFGSDEIEGAVNVKESSTNSKYYVLSYDIPWAINPESDLVLLYNNKEYVDTDYYSINESDLLNSKATFELRKSCFNSSDVKSFALVVLCDAKISKSTLRLDVINDKLLDDITSNLNKLYVEGEFNRRPVVPHYYLATDDKGTAYWENILNLTPQQTFQATTITLTAADLEGYGEGDIIDVEFTKDHIMKYDPKVDYPLVIIDELMALNIDMTTNANGELVCHIPYDKYIPSNIDDGEVRITVVMIRTDVAGEISERLSKDYISRKDAVDILSRGKLDLSDYASISELAKYSKINHTHSQYALKNHNHDYRYANFEHTHPELLKAVSQILAEYVSDEDKYNRVEDNSIINQILRPNKRPVFKPSGDGTLVEVPEDEEIDENGEYYTNSILDKLQQLSSEEEKKYVNLITALLEASGIKIEYGEHHSVKKAYIPDENIVLTDNSIRAINEALRDNNLEELPSGTHVNDAIQTLALLFKKDNVKDSQVLLESPIPVRLKNGPVGGIDEVWVKENLDNGILEAGTTLQEILKAILNPYISARSVVEKLTPVADDVVLHWFIKDENDEFKEVNPERLNEHEYGSKLYFSFEVLESGKKSVTITDETTGAVSEIRTVYVAEYIGEEYAEGVKIAYEESEPNIRIHYTSNVEITDNYGIREDGVALDGYLEYTQDFAYDYSDYFIGYGDELVNDPNNLRVSFSKFIENGEFKMNVPAGIRYIMLFIETTLDEDKNVFVSVEDEVSGTEIFHFFEECEGTYRASDDVVYNGYYYELMDNSEPVMLKIKIKEALNGK